MYRVLLSLDCGVRPGKFLAGGKVTIHADLLPESDELDRLISSSDFQDEMIELLYYHVLTTQHRFIDDLCLLFDRWLFFSPT